MAKISKCVLDEIVYAHTNLIFQYIDCHFRRLILFEVLLIFNGTISFKEKCIQRKLD